VLRGPVLPRIDGNLSKLFHLTESKTLQVRIDAYNALNHPLPAAAALNINGTGTASFGTIATKTGNAGFKGCSG